MTKESDLASRIEKLRVALESRTGEAADVALRALEANLGIASPSIDENAGIALSLAGSGRVEIEDTQGKSIVMSRQRGHAFEPTIVQPARPASRAHDGQPVGELISAVLMLKLRNTGKAGCRLRVDATGLYRNTARWGVMQVIMRRDGADGIRRLAALDANVATVEMAPDETIEILAASHAPRLDAAHVFGLPQPAHGLPERLV